MSSQWHGGKGSARRPEDKKQFDQNWEKIFNNKHYNNTEELDWPTPELSSFGELEEVRNNHPIRGKKV